jgi:glutamate synthase domain-containing protein 3
LVAEHHLRTGSKRAAELLATWDQSLKKFRQLVPVAVTQAVAAEPAPFMNEVPKTAA